MHVFGGGSDQNQFSLLSGCYPILGLWWLTESAGNGYIEGKELENFFRELEKARRGAGVAWRRYDTDRSGYIEANELKGFLSDLLKRANRHYDDQKLHEYTQTIEVKLTAEQFNAIFTFYDKDGNGYIDEQELDALLKDMYEKNNKNQLSAAASRAVVRHMHTGAVVISYHLRHHFPYFFLF
ncbi:CALB2 protein, partial [Polypterus senegalus]